MGRKKNLEVLKNRLAHVEREIKELETYQAGDQYQVDEFLAEKEALEWALRKLEAEPVVRKTIEVSLSAEDMVWARLEVSEDELSGVRAVVNALTAAKDIDRYQPEIELKEIEE